MVNIETKVGLDVYNINEVISKGCSSLLTSDNKGNIDYGIIGRN